MNHQRKIIPALRFNLLTSLYDPLMRLTMRESTFKNRLIRETAVTEGQRILDLGCGTATLTIQLKMRCPEARIIGVDGDAHALALAKRKAKRDNVHLELDEGDATALPYADGRFDKIVSSLLFHHLSPTGKRLALKEALRTLTPHGELFIADWGKPNSWIARAAFWGVQILDGFSNTADNVAGRLPSMIENAGFESVYVFDEVSTIFGTLALVHARKP